MSRDVMLRAYDEMLFSDAPGNVAKHPQMLFAERYLPEDHDAVLLDAGCGNGSYALSLVQRGYRNLTGIDLHEQVETGGLYEYRRGSIEDTGQAADSIDFLYSFSVIMHLPDPEAVLREFRRVLKPGSVMVFSACTKYSLFTMERRLRCALGGNPHMRGMRFTSARGFVKILESLGFEVLDVDGFQPNYFTDPAELPSRFLRKLLPEGLGPSATRPVRDSWPQDPSRWRRTLHSLFAYHQIIAARKGGV